VRLNKRFRKLVEQLSGGIGASIPWACQDWANIKAAYRFLSNPLVNEAEILQGHFQATRERLAGGDAPILMLHDTTEFNYHRDDTAAIGLGYQRYKPVRRPKLGPWQGAIDAILEADKSRPRRQRHTAKRIFELLREEHGYTAGYTIVKDYVRQGKIGAREMFVPLSHAPGEAQADFGEALVVVAGVECEAHYLAFDLLHSDDCFVVAFPAETTEAFLEGHARAFAYLSGIPTRILYSTPGWRWRGSWATGSGRGRETSFCTFGAVLRACLNPKKKGKNDGRF